MAVEEFDKYTYLKTYGNTREFAIHLAQLLSNYPNSSSFPLLAGENDNVTITRQEAEQILKKYLSSEGVNLSEEIIEKLASSEGLDQYTLFKILSYLKDKKREESLTLAARENALELYEQHLKDREAQLNDTQKQSYDLFRKSIDNYHKSLFAIQSSLSGEAPDSFAQNQNRETIFNNQELYKPEQQKEVIKVISRVAPLIVSSAETATIDKTEIAHNQLKELAKVNPDLTPLVILTAEPERKTAFFNLVNNSVTHATASTGTKLENILLNQTTLLSSAKKTIVLDRSQAINNLVNRVGKNPEFSQGPGSQATLVRILNLAFNDSVESAYKSGVPKSPDELITSAIRRANLDFPPETYKNNIDKLKQELIYLAPELEAHNQLQILEATKKGFGTNTQDSLVSRALSSTSLFLPREVKIALRSGHDPSEVLSVLANPFSSDSRSKLSQIRSNLGLRDRALYSLLLTRKRISYAVDKIGALEDAAWDKWFQFSDNLPHNRLADALAQWQFNLSEKYSPLKVWDRFKETRTKSLINNYKGSKTFGGRFIHRTASLYSKGDYSIGGLAKESALYALGKTAKWAWGKIAKTALYKSAQKIVQKGVAWLTTKAAAWGLGALVGAVSTGGISLIVMGAWEAAKFIWNYRNQLSELAKNALMAARGIATYIWLELKALFASIFATAKAALAGVLAGIAGFFVGGPIGAIVGAAGGYLIAANWGALTTIAQSALAGLTSTTAAFSTALQTAITATINSIPLFFTATIGTSFLYAVFTASAFTTAEITTSKPEFYYPTVIGGSVTRCNDTGPEITQQLANKLDKGTINYLPITNLARSPIYRLCIDPTMIIIHWSAGRDDELGNNATYNTLMSTGVLACQLATDSDDVMFMQPFYENQVEMAQCAGEWNTYSIQNEVSGVYFTSNPPPPREDVLERALESTCVMMEQYEIPWCNIRGHYEVPNNGGKTDPGEDFLQNLFIPEIKNRCPNDPQGMCK